MKLFKYEGYRVIIDEEAYALQPFRKIWDRDKSKDKFTAIQELGFIYFYCDPRSDYMFIADDTERAERIIADEGMGKWLPDKVVKEAVEFYNSFKTTTSLLIESSRKSAAKLRHFLETIDFTEEDKSGRLKYNPAQIVSTMKEVIKLIEVFDKAEKLAIQEQVETSKMRGGGEKTVFEDDLTI